MIRGGTYAKDVIKDALLVSDRAIGTDLTGKYLLVVGEGNIVERRDVEVGQLVGEMRVIKKEANNDTEVDEKLAEPVKKGISPSERYIIDGLQRARPGLPVRPTLTDEVFSLPATAKPRGPEPEQDTSASPPPEADVPAGAKQDAPSGEPGNEATGTKVPAPSPTGEPVMPAIEPPRVPQTRPTILPEVEKPSP